MFRTTFRDPTSHLEYNLQGSERAVHCVDGLLVFQYETHAGGVTKRTTAVVNGLPRQGYRMIQSDTHGLIVLRPGGVWCNTTYDGDPLKYWRFRGDYVKAPRQDILSPLPTTSIGPYEVYWSHLGWAPGGQGIDPYWFDWRRCPQGYYRAFQEAEATIMRNPIAYLQENGSPQWFHSKHFAMNAGCDRPTGYQAAPSNRLYTAVSYLADLQRYQPHDGQHYHRAYRAALALRDIDPFCADLCKWYQNHMHMEWLPDNKCNSYPHYFWSSLQRLKEIRQNPGVPSRVLGREFAHVARLEWTLNPDSTLSKYFEEMVLMAADKITGIPHLTTNPQENGNAYKWWPEGTPCAQTFQWYLLLDAMKMRPALEEICWRFAWSFPPVSRWCADGEGRQAGSFVPFMHLMRQDLNGTSLDYWINKSNSVDAGGSQPMNYMPEALWSTSV